MANLILAQTDNVAGCGAVVGCSGGTIAMVPQARESTKDGTPGVGELTVQILREATQAGVMFQSANNEPGKTTWDAGDWVVRLNLTTVQEYITWVATYVCRFDNACGSLAIVGSLTGQSISFSTSGVKQMTVAGAEQAANLSDEIYIVLLFTSTSAHVDKVFGFTPDQNIDTPIVTAAAYTLNVDPGSYGLTGINLDPLADRILAALPGSYALTGTDAILARGYFISADGGAYAITGNDATLLAQRLISADVGSYLITGVAAQTLAARLLNAEVGAYGIAGIAAGLVQAGGGAYVLEASPGNYLVTGTQAGLLATRILSADPGIYALIGIDAQALVSRLLNAEPGMYVIIGILAELVYWTSGAYVLMAEPGVYVFTGKAAQLIIESLKLATGSQISREEKELLLIGKGEPVFISKK